VHGGGWGWNVNLDGQDYLSRQQFHVAELDVYEGYHAGKVTVEVEFGSVEEAEAFQKPDWFGLELTNDKKWSNRSMARQSAKYAELERLLDEGLASGVALEGSSVFARLRARLKL
jgi:hypothetical protein